MQIIFNISLGWQDIKFSGFKISVLSEPQTSVFSSISDPHPKANLLQLNQTQIPSLKISLKKKFEIEITKTTMLYQF